MNRSLLFGLLALAACNPWKVISRVDENPFAATKRIYVLPLDWTKVIIDGDAESDWDQTNDEGMKREWPLDKQAATQEFQSGLVSEINARLQVVPIPAVIPGTAPLLLRSRVVELKTGGIRPLFVTIRSQIVNEHGTITDEISNQVKVSHHGFRVGQFLKRLRQGSYECGGNVGVYLVRRAGVD